MTLHRPVPTAEATPGNAGSLSRFVEADEFCDLAISVKKLRRSDNSEAGLRGLVEVETGVRYLIEERRLLEHLRSK